VERLASIARGCGDFSMVGGMDLGWTREHGWMHLSVFGASVWLSLSIGW